jgi:hypothetical protein
MTFQELSTDLQFEIANLPAQCRLRGAKPSLGRVDEAAFFGDCNEVTEMTKFIGYLARPERHRSSIQSLA